MKIIISLGKQIIKIIIYCVKKIENENENDHTSLRKNSEINLHKILILYCVKKL